MKSNKWSVLAAASILLLQTACSSAQRREMDSATYHINPHQCRDSRGGNFYTYVTTDLHLEIDRADFQPDGEAPYQLSIEFDMEVYGLGNRPPQKHEVQFPLCKDSDFENPVLEKHTGTTWEYVDSTRWKSTQTFIYSVSPRSDRTDQSQYQLKGGLCVILITQDPREKTDLIPTNYKARLYSATGGEIPLNQDKNLVVPECLNESKLLVPCI